MSDIPSLETIIATYGLQPKKSLGQHFLLNPTLLKTIIQHAGNLRDTHVIEIGPGPGGLTRAMLQSDATSIHVIEKDVRCINALTLLQQYYTKKLHIIQADALKIDLIKTVSAPRAIIANLPYNVGTAMLLNWLDAIAISADSFLHLTLMFQKEVGERICAAPGTKSYGRLSVMAQWLCECHYLFDVPATAFSPPPKVASAVIQLVPRKQRLLTEKLALEKVLHTVFSKRRKMLRVSLKSISDDPVALCNSCGIDSNARPETLSVEQFIALANAAHKIVL